MEPRMRRAVATTAGHGAGRADVARRMEMRVGWVPLRVGLSGGVDAATGRAVNARDFDTGEERVFRRSQRAGLEVEHRPLAVCQ